TIGGTTSPRANDESTYVAEDHTSKGQTFTTGTNPHGYALQSFTFQHVNWPALTQPGTFYDIQPGDQWEIEIGAMNGTTKTPLVKYTAAYDGAAMAGAGNSGTGRYLTFNVSGIGVQLEANTTYYFEVAPLEGSPFLELNSSRNGTYGGGTAYRGNVAGTIAAGVIPLAGDYIFHAHLEAKTATQPGTVGYWSFEEGVAGTYVPYARPAAGQYQGSIFDQSGNANHLSVWGANWHWYRPQVPAASTPQTGAANSLSIQNAGSFPAISATGTSLTHWSPTAWTIEAAIRPDDATNGFQTFIGRDSYGAHAGDPALAALYFVVMPTGGLRIHFTDAAGNVWSITSAANSVKDAKWHAVAATSDGSTLSLYLKNISDGDANYTLLGSVNISASANPGLSTGAGDGGDWDSGVFSFARGLHNGGHTDRFFGHLDDIRFSEGALKTSELLYSAPPPLTPAQSWRMTHFETTASSGDAADDADPDKDGVSNLLERAFGGNPKLPGTGLLPAIEKDAPLLTITYTRAKGMTDLMLSVQESTDASLSSWIAAEGTETVTDLGTTERVTFTVAPGDAGRKFLRVRVVPTP
ncbi:MAG: LamG-like jellyroll fold domain-containing protein, partial [Chthoniobacteraceae bacterium]